MRWGQQDIEQRTAASEGMLSRMPSWIPANQLAGTVIIVGGGNTIAGAGGGTGINKGTFSNPATAYDPTTMPTCIDGFGWGHAWFNGVDLGLVSCYNLHYNPFIMAGQPCYSKGVVTLFCNDGTTMQGYNLV